MRDSQHPNTLSYSVAVDLLSYCFIKAALEFFTGGTQHELHPTIEAAETKTPLAHSPIWAYPMMSYKTEYSPCALPGQRLFGHCLTSLRPTFARINTIQIIQNSGPIEDVGNPRRPDRKTSLFIGPCCNASKFIVSVYVPNIVYVILSCGLDQATECRNMKAEFVDIGIIQPNVDVRSDAVGLFYRWVHRMDRITTNVPRRMLLCSRSHTILLSRLVVLQRVVS